MTTYDIFSRPFATLSLIVTLATGVALTAAPSTARAESLVFGGFEGDGDDDSFMDYTDDAYTSSPMGQPSGAGAGAATSPAPQQPSGRGSTSPGTAIPASSASKGNIIMRDGGICDPIRHMGC